MDNEEPEDDMEYQERPPRPHQLVRKGGNKRWLIIIGIALAVLLVGGALYWFVLRSKPAPTAKTSATATKEAAPVSTGPKTYKSTKLGMGVTYDSSWKLSENADKSEVILTSPKTTYTRRDGTSTSGAFTVKLRHGLIPDAMTATVQKDVAVRDSEVIAYTKPTANQRQYTNLSYAGTDPNTFQFFIISGNTSLKSGAAIGYNINLIGDSYLIAGGFGSDENDALTFDPVPASAVDNSIVQQAIDIAKSVQID